jgi:hypothetical protein
LRGIPKPRYEHKLDLGAAMLGVSFACCIILCLLFITRSAALEAQVIDLNQTLTGARIDAQSLCEMDCAPVVCQTLECPKPVECPLPVIEEKFITLYTASCKEWFEEARCEPCPKCNAKKEG